MFCFPTSIAWNCEVLEAKTSCHHMFSVGIFIRCISKIKNLEFIHGNCLLSMWHLRAGLIWITGAYSFSCDWKPYTGALSKISQKYIIDTRHRKVPSSSSPTPWGRSVSAGGKKGSWGGRRTEWHTKVASFSLFVIGLIVAERPSFFPLFLLCGWMYPQPVVLLLCQDRPWHTAFSSSFLSSGLFALLHLSGTSHCAPWQQQQNEGEGRQEQKEKLPVFGKVLMFATSSVCKTAYSQN